MKCFKARHCSNYCLTDQCAPSILSSMALKKMSMLQFLIEPKKQHRSLYLKKKGNKYNKIEIHRQLKNTLRSLFCLLTCKLPVYFLKNDNSEKKKLHLYMPGTVSGEGTIFALQTWTVFCSLASRGEKVLTSAHFLWMQSKHVGSPAMIILLPSVLHWMLGGFFSPQGVCCIYMLTLFLCAKHKYDFTEQLQ